MNTMKAADDQVPVRHMCMVIVMLHIKRDGQRSRRFSLSRTVRPPSCLTTFAYYSQPALALAMARDGSSGGTIRMCVITKDKVERHFVPGNELPKFWEGKEIIGQAAKPVTVGA